jgi:hypothetical protein
MAFSVSNYAGAPGIATKDTTQKCPLGTIVRGVDPTYGEGEFIYLKGVGSTIAGSVVEYSTSFQTGLATSATTLSRPLAVAMTTTTASYYGWYQISGLAQMAKATSLSLAADAYVGAAAGLAIAAASGKRINGAQVAVVASAVSGTAPDTVTVMINRPTDSYI